jgi:anti-anti-sigma factor
MALDISVSKKNGTHTVTLVGRLVDVDAKRFAKRMEQVYGDGPQRLVVDVSRLNFINSHGLGVLVFYHTTMQRDQKEFVILNSNSDPRAYINRLMELTNLNRVIKTAQSAAEL